MSAVAFPITIILGVVWIKCFLPDNFPEIYEFVLFPVSDSLYGFSPPALHTEVSCRLNRRRKQIFQFVFGHSIFRGDYMNPGKKQPVVNREADRPIPENIYPVIDNDLARDNVENDLTDADMQDLEMLNNDTQGKTISGNRLP